jgi:hypothetical protein
VTVLRVHHTFLDRDEWRLIHEVALVNGGAVADPHCVHGESFAYDCEECRRELEAKS